MLVRNMLELNRKGLIPQFMKDAWTKKYGAEYPTMETPEILRLVRIDAWVNKVMPPLVIPLLVGAVISLGTNLVFGEMTWVVLSLSMLVLVTWILPRAVTYRVQGVTRTNFFNCSLTNLLSWIGLDPSDPVAMMCFGHMSQQSLSDHADEVLHDQALKILALEEKPDRTDVESAELKELRRKFGFKYRVLNDLGLVDCPWNRFFVSEWGKFASNHQCEVPIPGVAYPV